MHKILLNSGRTPYWNSWPFYQGPGWNLPCQFKLTDETWGGQGGKEKSGMVSPTWQPGLLSRGAWNWFCFIIKQIDDKMGYVMRAIVFIKKKKKKDPSHVLWPPDGHFFGETKFSEYTYRTNSTDLVIVQKPFVSRCVKYHSCNSPIIWSSHFLI